MCFVRHLYRNHERHSHGCYVEAVMEDSEIRSVDRQMEELERDSGHSPSMLLGDHVGSKPCD